MSTNKVLRKGSVKLTFIEESEQGYIDIAYMCVFHYLSLDDIYIQLSGKEKIIIDFDTDPHFKNPTKVSTGHTWKNYSYDDALKVTISKRTMNAVICFFNLKNCKNKIIYN